MSCLRAACVGTGFIANRHLAALSQFPDVELVAVADAVRERAEATADRYGGRAYDDGLELLRTEDLDAVWLCVPPFAHGPLESAAVNRDLPFFVEKPLALDLATAVDIAEQVRGRDLVTAVGYHWRHLDLVEQVARLLDDAPAQLALGYWLDQTPLVPWWSRREGSGSQPLQQTSHIFDLARLLVGEVDIVHAVERSTPRERFIAADVPTSTAVTLLFAGGAIGTIASTCVLDSRHRVGLHLIADGMAVEVSERALSDHELRVVTSAGERVVSSQQDPIESEDRDFVDTVLGRVEQVRVPYEEALRTHGLAWAADRSAREGVPVDLASEPLGVS